jgi:hypothetical protein
MRMTMPVVSLFPALLSAVLLCASAIPAFASGDDKPQRPAAPVTTNAATPRPDREKKVFTNDDIDRMWPKSKAPASANAPQPQQGSIVSSRLTRTAAMPVPPERDPLWYAQQIESLTAQRDRIAQKEYSLRQYRQAGTGAGLRFGLNLYAPCEGFTTDNEIQQLALQRQQIDQQLAALEDTAHRNDLEPGILRDAPVILAAAQKPPTPEEIQAALKERQAQLLSELSATQNELADMSAEAAALNAALLRPTRGWGGNMTTDLLDTLDHRADEIKAALDETEDLARQAAAAHP